jgi:hypothetical protein
MSRSTFSKEPKVNATQQAAYDFFSKPAKIAAALKEAGPPDVDPFANVKGDSDKFRVINGSASPDGRFAIAMGLPLGKPIGTHYVMETVTFTNPAVTITTCPITLSISRRRGYWVKQAAIISGQTDVTAIRQCILRWSLDSLKFVQLWDDKWGSTECVAGKINPAPKFAGAVDLNKAIEKKTYEFAKKRFDAENGGNLSLWINRVANDSVIDLDASEVCSSGDCKGETVFAVN